MKTIVICLAVAPCLLRLHSAEFRNLDFDEADLSRLQTITHTVPPHSYQVGTIGDLLPGWSITYDGVPYRGLVDFNRTAGDVPSLLYSPLTFPVNEYYFFFFPSAIEPSGGGVRHDLSLWQIGRVPDGAWELLTYGGDLLYMNSVPLIPRNLDGFRQYAWDVRQFAGSEVKFEVRSYDELGLRGFGLVNIDIFGFAIPEPSEWALLLLGGGILFWAATSAKPRRAGRPPQPASGPIHPD